MDGTVIHAFNVSEPQSRIYHSTNSGAYWTSNSAPFPGFSFFGYSVDGSKMAGSTYMGPIYFSTNSGVTWFKTASVSNLWMSICASADWGKVMAVSLSFSNGVFITTNLGLTWSAAPVPQSQGIWQGGAISSDGTKLVAIKWSDGIYLSTNGGSSWFMTDAPTNKWNAVAMSSDGSLIAAIISNYPNGGLIYVSTNAGVNWKPTSAPIKTWSSVACSADGQKIVAGGGGSTGLVHTSTNAGLTWDTNGSPAGAWTTLIVTADGNKLFAFDDSDNGGVWMLPLPPKPKLSIDLAGNQSKLSWVLPSTNFILQQASELKPEDWTILPVVPELNKANLQLQVWLSPTNTSGFYRLATP